MKIGDEITLSGGLFDGKVISYRGGYAVRMISITETGDLNTWTYKFNIDGTASFDGVHTDHGWTQKMQAKDIRRSMRGE